MNRLIHGELIKVRTTRTALAFAVVTVLLAAVSVVVTINDGLISHDTSAQLAALNLSQMSIPLLLFGIVGATSEFRHRTLAPAVMIAPDRVRLTLARVLAYALTGLAVGIVMIAVTLLLGLPLLAIQSSLALNSSDYMKLIVRAVLATTLMAALGTGIGVLLRNQVLGVITAFVWLLILEPLVSFIYEPAQYYTITGALTELSASHGLVQGTAFTTLIAWSITFIALGLLIDRWREIE